MTALTRRLACLPLLLLMTAGAWAEPTVALSEAKINAGVGDTIVVDIVLNDFPTTEGGGVTLKYNPSVVRVVGVELNEAAWNFVTRSGVIDNDRGRVTDLLFSSFQGASGDVVVATITLETLRKGRSRLKLFGSKLNPFAGGGQRLDVRFKRSGVRVR